MPKDYVSEIDKNIKMLMNAKKIKILSSSKRKYFHSKKNNGYFAPPYSEVFADNKKIRFIERMVFEVDLTDSDNLIFRLSFKFPNPKKIYNPHWDSFVILRKKGFYKADRMNKKREMEREKEKNDNRNRLRKEKRDEKKRGKI